MYFFRLQAAKLIVVYCLLTLFRGKTKEVKPIVGNEPLYLLPFVLVLLLEPPPNFLSLNLLARILKYFYHTFSSS